ncbi:MAG TPA: hypothetical protein VI231_18610 [Candidatus Binatia bacterium]|jgi:hypothetical protein
MTIPSSLRRASKLFSLWLLVAAPLGAAEQPAQPVQLKIGTIFATNQAECLDSQLAKLKQQLEVVKYRCYRLIREESQKGTWQGNTVFEIPGGRSLVVQPFEFRNSRVSLKVRLLEGEKPIVDTTVRFPNKGNFLLGGPPHEGGVLILSISAAAQ